jgi:predicted HicB family RNase H-like nuclease
MKQSDQYLKIVEWSDEDSCYVGTCPGLMYGGIHGKDEVKVYRELCQAVEEVIKLYKEDKKPFPPPTSKEGYSGKFVLRVSPDLHKTLALRALQTEESLNNYCQNILKAAVFPPARKRAKAS